MKSVDSYKKFWEMFDDEFESLRKKGMDRELIISVLARKFNMSLQQVSNFIPKD